MPAPPLWAVLGKNGTLLLRMRIGYCCFVSLLLSCHSLRCPVPPDTEKTGATDTEALGGHQTTRKKKNAECTYTNFDQNCCLVLSTSSSQTTPHNAPSKGGGTRGRKECVLVLGAFVCDQKAGVHLGTANLFWSLGNIFFKKMHAGGLETGDWRHPSCALPPFFSTTKLIRLCCAHLGLLDHRASAAAKLAEHAQVVLVYLANVGAVDKETVLANLDPVRLKVDLVLPYLNRRGQLVRAHRDG